MAVASPPLLRSRSVPDYPVPDFEYPSSDGNPMAENTQQFRWIVTIVGGLEAFFRHEPDIFVAGDLLWYPVHGHPEIRAAPDAMVVFGRPKGDRPSYQQWREDDVPPQVVFEVLSPGNRGPEMARKLEFYDRYGVEEYYIYDPDEGELAVYRRAPDGVLAPVRDPRGWISPRLGIRFNLDGPDLVLLQPDGRRFASYVELAEAQEASQARAEAERRRAEAERRRAESERERADRLTRYLKSLGLELPED